VLMLLRDELYIVKIIILIFKHFFPLLSMPDIFLVYFIFSLSLLLMYCCSLCFKVEASNGDERAALSFLLCITWVTAIGFAGLLGLFIWSVQDYFHIDDACWDYIEEEGSSAFKTACQLFGILNLIFLCIFGALCCCGFCLVACSPRDSFDVEAQAGSYGTVP